MRTRSMMWTAAVGVALLGGTVLQARSAAGPTAPAVAAPLSEPGVAAQGRVVAYPGSEVRVAAERVGRLVRVVVEEGQAVKKGDLLAEIDSDELRATLDEARARVVEAGADLRLAQLDLDRRERLVFEKIATLHDRDLARRDVETAAARLETAKAAVQRYETQLAKTRILAPIDGTVVDRAVDAGEMVETGDPVVTVADLSRLRVEGEADEADAGRLTLGTPVVITADGYAGQAFRGTIEEIADSVTLRRLKPQDPSRPTDTRVLAVKVAFAEPSPLRLGTTVDLRIAAR